MPLIAKPDNAMLNPMGNINIPAMELPAFRKLLADERKTTTNILIQTPYALGDCVCAEPVVRYAVKAFAKCNVSLLTPYPELYSHIPLSKVYNDKKEKPDWDKYNVLKCYYASDELQSDFVHNFNMAIGDYIATCIFKGNIPVADRNIILKPSSTFYPAIEDSGQFGPRVVIHAGKHWISKTFPKKWWDEVIWHLLAKNITPILIGATIEDGKRGYVEVDATHCIDLRNKLTVMQSVSVLQKADVVLTNDSAPYHMAASGNAHIGVFSTVRGFDFIGHWRPYENGQNEWNNKIENLALGSMWTDAELDPTRNGAKYDVIDHKTLMSWLPEPKEVAEWTMGKLGSH